MFQSVRRPVLLPLCTHNSPAVLHLCEYVHYTVTLIRPRSFGARLIGKGWGGSCFALTDDSFTDGMADIIARAYEGVFHHRCKYYNVSAAQGAHILNI